MKLFAYSVREFDEKPFFDKYCSEFGIEYAYVTEYPNDENLALMRGYDAVSIIVSITDANRLAKMKEYGVKYLSTRSIGVDHIDLAAAKKLGIKVSNVSYPPSSVANYAIMLMLMCCRNIKYILDSNAIQDFSLTGKMGKEISNCTIGVIGTGRIGKTVIEHLSGFGCKILAYDPYENEEVKKYATYVDLQTIYQQSDIITLHIPSAKENYHLINAAAIAQMKDGVILINTGRGDLIDTYALIDALEAGKVGGAGLDVLENEEGLYYVNLAGQPLNKRELALLKAFPNVIVTPHTAFYTSEAVEYMVANSIKGCLFHAQNIDNPFSIV
jgi:Lactate dehydrogenase and related dehydrogenases